MMLAAACNEKSVGDAGSDGNAVNDVLSGDTGGHDAGNANDASTTDVGADVGQDASPFDPQHPPTNGREAMTAWLSAGYYKLWHCEASPVRSRSTRIHGADRVCTNNILWAAGNAGEYPVGSSSVKEIYGPDGGGTDIIGYAVSYKAMDYIRPDGGDAQADVSTDATADATADVTVGMDVATDAASDAGFDATTDDATADVATAVDGTADAARDGATDASTDASRPPIIQGYAWYWYERVPLNSTTAHDDAGVTLSAFGDDPLAQTRCVVCHSRAGAPTADGGVTMGRDFVYVRVP